ncbi:hypothetical protein HY988_07745 [Candidatus Micrarchaeota archaeon]|nr:hypothetical protein [Candidatus Micrarchaeota archaeon]
MRRRLDNHHFDARKNSAMERRVQMQRDLAALGREGQKKERPGQGYITSILITVPNPQSPSMRFEIPNQLEGPANTEPKPKEVAVTAPVTPSVTTPETSLAVQPSNAVALATESPVQMSLARRVGTALEAFFGPGIAGSVIGFGAGGAGILTLHAFASEASITAAGILGLAAFIAGLVWFKFFRSMVRIGEWAYERKTGQELPERDEPELTGRAGRAGFYLGSGIGAAFLELLHRMAQGGGEVGFVVFLALGGIAGSLGYLHKTELPRPKRIRAKAPPDPNELIVLPEGEALESLVDDQERFRQFVRALPPAQVDEFEERLSRIRRKKPE